MISESRDTVKPSKKGPSQELRIEARLRYEAGEPLNAIAASMNLHRNTLRRIRDRECWTVPIEVPKVAHKASIQRKAQAEVISLVIDRAEASGIIKAEADLLGQSLEAHVRISLKLSQSAERMMDDWTAGRIEVPKGQTEADVFSNLVTGVSRAVAASRDIGGLRPGQSSTIKNANADEPIRIVQRRLEPFRIPVDEKGRKLDVDR